MSEAERQVAVRGGNGKAFPFFPALPFPFLAFFGFKIESRDAFEASDSSSEEVDELDGVVLRGFFALLLVFTGEGEREGIYEETEVSEPDAADDSSSSKSFADRVIRPVEVDAEVDAKVADRVILTGRSSDSTALGALLLRFCFEEELSDSESESALRAFEGRPSGPTALGALRG
jgi:hypothetical protein